jgi:hypothetical protein
MMIRIKSILGVAAFAVSAQALAVPVTVVGSTVSFTFDSALAGLFGAPAVNGDALYFTPTSFKAQSSSGAGFVVTSQTFNVAVTANAGYQIAGATLTESGDYFNINTNFAGNEGVAVSGQFILRDLESPFAAPATAGIVASTPLTATTSLATFGTTTWAAGASVNVPLGWGGQDGIVGGVNVTLQDILIASSLNAASSAFIEKKFAGIEIVTTPVPEPANYAMFLAGLGLLGYFARRRAVA